ncbi:MAG: prepilin peptidase [Thermoleophilia bacterium]|nr:prepilin peptidase [Thermoleophilia bacterium]
MSLTAGIVLTSTLAAVSVTDIRRRVIPNRALLVAVALWLGITVWSGGEGAASALIAASVITSPLLVAALVRPEGMGMGDVKLVAVISLYLGWGAWVALLAGLFLAGLTGVLISLGTRRPPSETSLPLAPFLAAGVFISLIPLQ